MGLSLNGRGEVLLYVGRLIGCCDGGSDVYVDVLVCFVYSFRNFLTVFSA